VPSAAFPCERQLHDWPLIDTAGSHRTAIPETMSANTIDPLVHLAERGFGIAFLPLSPCSRRSRRAGWSPFLNSTSARPENLPPCGQPAVSYRRGYAPSWTSSRITSISAMNETPLPRTVFAVPKQSILSEAAASRL